MAKLWETEEGLRQIGDYCRKHLRCRGGILAGKRVEYFKGNKLIKLLLGAEDKKEENGDDEAAATKQKKKGKDTKRPDIKDEKEALEVCDALLKHEFFHLSVKDKEMNNQLKMVVGQHPFDAKHYYTWIYEGNKAFSNLLTTLIIVGFLLIVCFPIWPMFLKVWMWYLSVTLLIFMLSFLMVRAVVWFAMWILGFEFWILPRLFDESLAFAESFVPVYSFQKASEGQVWYRLVAMCGVIYFFYWAYTQPNDLDNFRNAQRDFLADLYAGNLLSDVSQESKENIDKPKGPKSLDDILRELDEEDEVDDEELGENVIDSLLDDMFDDEDDSAKGDTAAEAETEPATEAEL